MRRCLLRQLRISLRSDRKNWQIKWSNKRNQQLLRRTVKHCLGVYAISTGGEIRLVKLCEIEMESPFMSSSKGSTVELNISENI